MVPLVTLVTFLPGAAGLALLLVPRRAAGVLRPASLVVAVVTFLLSLPLYFGFDAEIVGYQFEEHWRWMPTLGVSYHVGVDGTARLLEAFGMLVRQPSRVRDARDLHERGRASGGTMLILGTGMRGVFDSLARYV